MTTFGRRMPGLRRTTIRSTRKPQRTRRFDLGGATIVVVIAMIMVAKFAPLFTAVEGDALTEPRTLTMVDHHFVGCDEARAMGMTDIPSWHPSYRATMDGDGDGLACEPYR